MIARTGSTGVRLIPLYYDVQPDLRCVALDLAAQDKPIAKSDPLYDEPGKPKVHYSQSRLLDA